MRGKLVQLQNGGHVALDEYGDPEGTPVFFYHGWPSSRTMAELANDAAVEIGVRIISLDRPGIRDSSLARERSLLDWPVLMKEIAAEMGLEQYRILAISGGAPYAYVAAWALPEQVRAIAVVSGAPPIAELSDHVHLLRLYRWLLALRVKQPRLLRAGFHLVRPFACLKPPVRFRPLLLKCLQRADAEAMRDSRAFEACFESARQAWRASADGVMIDAEIYARPWGFPLEDVRVPVRLWHGTGDRAFGYPIAEEIARRLPNCQLQIVPDAGHFSLPIRNVRRILKDLIAT